MSILAKGLCKSFDNGKIQALSKIDLKIEQGEFVAVIGLSGAGKSTFLRTINGKIPPDLGSLEVLGLDVTTLGHTALVGLRRQVAFIFQQFNLLKNLTVFQNVLVGRSGHAPLWRVLTGLFSATDKSLAKTILDSVGLEGRYFEKVRNLSGGEQQRVAIARALMQEPKIILADEPMASLDTRLSELVIQLLEGINREKNITVVINIHILDLAKKYAKRIVGLNKGNIVFDGAPSELNEAAITRIFGQNPERRRS